MRASQKRGRLIFGGETIMALLGFLMRRRTPKVVPMNEARAQVYDRMALIDYQVARQHEKERRRQAKRRLKEPTAGI